MRPPLPALSALAAIALAISTPLHAKMRDNRVVSDQWCVNAGGFLVELDTEAQVGIGSALGSVLDFEQALDFDPTRSVGRLDGLFRMHPKHAIEIGLLAIDRKALGTFDDLIQFRNLTFDAAFESEFDMRLFKAGYRYSFSNDGRLDAGISMGLSTFRFSLSIAGEVTDPNGTTILGNDRAESKILAPIPYLGIFLDYAFTPRLVMRATPQFFDIESGDLEGRYLDARWTLDFYFSRYFGIGAGYNSVDLLFEDTDETPVHVQYRYSGVLVYLSFVAGHVEPTR